MRTDSASRTGRSAGHLIGWSLLLFVILVIALAVVVWLVGGVDMAMEYEGFD